jgi:Stress responsive A/B Barrel Domain
MTHAFVAEFANSEDRDYYVSKDPVHLALNEKVKHLIERVQVIDFMQDVYV